MAKKKWKPTGWRAFDKLARRLIAVPKSDVDAAVERGKRKRRKK